MTAPGRSASSRSCRPCASGCCLRAHSYACRGSRGRHRGRCAATCAAPACRRCSQIWPLGAAAARTCCSHRAPTGPSWSSPRQQSAAPSRSCCTAADPVPGALRDLVPRWQRYWPRADAAAIADDVGERLVAAVGVGPREAPRPLTGGVGALTCAAGDCVVKVLPRHHPEAELMLGEGAALGHWRETGAAVGLVDVRDGGMTLLLPRLRPATKLDDLDYDEQLVVAGGLVRRVHSAGEPPSSLPSIDDHVRAFRRVADPELNSLLATQPARVAVHADLHGGNVLRDGDRWVAIDPDSVRGDPHLDIWLLVCPQAPPLPDDDAAEMWRRVQVYAQAAGLDPGRAAAWVRVVARAEAVLTADSAYSDWPERMRRIAAALS